MHKTMHIYGAAALKWRCFVVGPRVKDLGAGHLVCLMLLPLQIEELDFG